MWGRWKGKQREAVREFWVATRKLSGTRVQVELDRCSYLPLLVRPVFTANCPLD